MSDSWGPAKEPIQCNSVVPGYFTNWAGGRDVTFHVIRLLILVWKTEARKS